jgi:nucleoid DNA-binding protein
MATVTKRDLVIRLSNDTGMTQQQVLAVLQGAVDTITESLAHGDDVVIRNFGSFHVKETKEKIGRNPNRPGSDVRIPPRAVVKFKPGKELKEKVARLLPELRQR